MVVATATANRTTRSATRQHHEDSRRQNRRIARTPAALLRLGRLGDFKAGAFQIAIEAKAPILPVALHGTAGCVDASGPRAAHATAQVLAPIETDGLGPRDLAALRDLTHDRIAAALAPRAAVVEDYFLDGPDPA